MNQDEPIFSGCIPALMTPCDDSGKIDFDALAAHGKAMIDAGMRAVVYCGSMGEWPLLTDAQRCAGVEALVEAEVPVIVGTGAQNTARAADIAAHAAKAGAQGLMVIPRVLSRGTAGAAQRNHFAAVLRAAHQLPAVIYNSPYYGFETRAELFFELAYEHANLVGFKEFGGAESLSYAAEFITSGRDDLALLVGVDTQVVHGIAGCGAQGAITGVGNALPREVLRLVELSFQAARGDSEALRLARELDAALAVLATFDEGPDLALYYKHLMMLEGHARYANPLQSDDVLLAPQRAFIEREWQRFRAWWDSWPGATAATTAQTQAQAQAQGQTQARQEAAA